MYEDFDFNYDYSIDPENFLAFGIGLIVITLLFLVVSLILWIASAVIAYKDAEYRNESGVYWCLYDLFVNSFYGVGAIFYYREVVKPFNEKNPERAKKMPKILWLKAVFSFVFFLVFLGMFLSIMPEEAKVFVGIFMIIFIIIFAILGVITYALFALKCYAIIVLYKDAKKRVPSSHIVWSIFSIFFTGIVLISYVIVNSKKTTSVESVGQISLIDDSSQKTEVMSSNTKAILIAYGIIQIVIDIFNFFSYISNYLEQI